MPLSMERVKVNRNFCNKLWNAARFLEPKMVTSGGVIDEKELVDALLSGISCSEPAACAEASASALEDYRGDAGTRATASSTTSSPTGTSRCQRRGLRGPGGVMAGLVVFLRGVSQITTSLRAARY